jgi:hypothetical protein
VLVLDCLTRRVILLGELGRNDDYNLFKEKLMARIPKISTPLGNIPLAHDG